MTKRIALAILAMSIPLTLSAAKANGTLPQEKSTCPKGTHLVWIPEPECEPDLLHDMWLLRP